MKRVTLIFGLLITSFCYAQDKQTEVMMKMGYLRNALLTKDSATLNDLLAPDVTYGHTNGMIQTKSQLIRSVMSGEQKYKSINPTNMVIRIYGNTAVVTLQPDVSMIFQGKPLDMKMFVTVVWVKKDKWQIVARQSVKQ